MGLISQLTHAHEHPKIFIFCHVEKKANVDPGTWVECDQDTQNNFKGRTQWHVTYQYSVCYSKIWQGRASLFP